MTNTTRPADGHELTEAEGVATVLAAHETRISVMGGWSARNGKDSDRCYGWSCACGEHSPDSFKVDLTRDEADRGRFAHVATVLAARGADAAVTAPCGDTTPHGEHPMPCDSGCQPDWHRDSCAIYGRCPGLADAAVTDGGLRARLYVALTEQRVIDSQKFGEAPYAPVTWADVDAALDAAPAPTVDRADDAVERAEAWDEGHRWACDLANELCRDLHPNPHRATNGGD